MYYQASQLRKFVYCEMMLIQVMEVNSEKFCNWKMERLKKKEKGHHEYDIIDVFGKEFQIGQKIVAKNL